MAWKLTGASKEQFSFDINFVTLKSEGNEFIKNIYSSTKGKGVCNKK